MKLKFNVHNWLAKWPRFLVELGVHVASSAQRHSNKSMIIRYQKSSFSCRASIATGQIEKGEFGREFFQISLLSMSDMEITLNPN